jgi:hypothetical protein
MSSPFRRRPGPVRRGGLRGVKIKDAAADRELADAVDLLAALVSGTHKAGGELREILGGALFEHDRVGGVDPGRDGILQRGLGGGGDDFAASVQDAAEHGEPLVLIFGGGALRAAEVEIPRGVGERGPLAEVPVQILGGAHGGGLIRRDKQNGLAGALRGGRGEHRAVGAGEAGGKNGHGKTPPKRFKHLSELRDAVHEFQQHRIPLMRVL